MDGDRLLAPPTPSRKVHPAVKVAVGLVVLAGVGVLFYRSVNDAQAEPYTVRAAHLAGWIVEANSGPDDGGALVSLRPPRELSMNLFRQLFSRHMESLASPNAPGVALVLRGEIANTVAVDAIVALARAAGVGQSPIAPTCLGSRRISEPGLTRQVYFVWFDVPGFDQFRRSLSASAGPGFNPAGLSPVLLVAAQPNFLGWMPIVVDQNRDCTAAVVVN